MPSPSATRTTAPLLSPTTQPTDAPAPSTPNLTPTGRPTVTPTATPVAPQHLAMARDGNILVGDLRGKEATSVAQVELADAWDLSRGRLAMAQGGLVQMIDLVHGDHWETSLQQGMAAVQLDVLWGETGQDLLLTVTIEDGETPRTVLQAIDGNTGASLATHLLPEATRATVLAFFDERDTVWAVVHAEKEELGSLQVISLVDGTVDSSYALAGRQPMALHPATGQLAYLAADQDALCVGTPDQTSIPCLPLPKGQLPTSYAWSEDGQELALMLQPQPGGDQAVSNDAGLWLYTVSDGELRQVIAHQGSMSRVLGWAPDDEMILARHSGGTIPDHVYLIRPDGGDRRILPGSDRIVPLGWIPPRASDASDITLDPWLTSFSAQAADARALADTTARWLATTEEQDDEALSRQLRAYVQASGQPLELAGPQVYTVAEGIHLVQLPPLTIYVCDHGSAFPIASGHRIQQARLEGDLLAVVHATIGASSVNPDFVLAQRADEQWQVAWTPQGQRYWIATDGEIGFVDGTIDRLFVRGSSFTLEPGPGDPFRQCHACLHRWFETIWVRSGTSYALAGGESDDDLLWTLTQRTPYAVLHQALVRLRSGQSDTPLVTADARRQAEALGLLEPELILTAEEETGETVVFADLDTGTRYRATIRDEQLVSVSALGR